MLLKNSLTGEKGGRVENVGLHNRATFNDLDSGKESLYPEKISFRVFQQNRPETEIRIEMTPVCLEPCCKQRILMECDPYISKQSQF